MAGMSIKDVRDIKENVQKVSSNGFGYFMKNAGLVVLLFLAAFMITNPDIFTNPSAFFQQLTVMSAWPILILFLIICGVYQLGKGIMEDSKKVNNTELTKDIMQERQKEHDRKDAEHMEMINKKIKIAPKINILLRDILIDLDACRACIFEMHNGTNSLNGIPFLYADCTYEATDADTDEIADEFKNFSICRYPFVTNHFEDGTWIGSASDVSKEDSRFATKLKFADAPYNAFVVLQGIKAPIGFLTVSFKDDNKHPSKTEIIAELNQKSQIIATLLDKDIKLA